MGLDKVLVMSEKTTIDGAIGLELRAIRQQAGLGRREAAQLLTDKLGVRIPYNTLACWETDLRPVSLARFVEACRAYSVVPSHVLADALERTDHAPQASENDTDADGVNWHNVGIVVFMRAPGIHADEAAARAERHIRHALGTYLHDVRLGQDMPVLATREIASAVSAGYLQMTPTDVPARERLRDLEAAQEGKDAR